MASKYPNGFKHGVSIRGVPIVQTQPGRVFWVYNGAVVDSGSTGNSTGSDSNDGSYNRPWATLNYAFSQCTAGRGDVIFIKPGHAETLSAAAAVAASTADVAVIGLGNGVLRPTFTFDTGNTSSITVSANNISFVGCIFIANFLTIAAPFVLTTAKGFSLEQCEFQDTSAALNFANVVKSTGAANTVDGLYVADNLYGSIGTTFNTFILTANDIDRLQVYRNTVLSIATTDVASLVVVTTGVLTNGVVTRNQTKRKNTTSTAATISVGGTTSSVLAIENFASTLDTSTNVNWAVTTGVVGWGNSLSGAIAGQGFPIPALDS